jgi:predicted aconitase
MRLDSRDKDMIAGGEGAACQFAFDILLRFAESVGAESFIDIASAHVDGCLYHGQVSLDFAERFVADGGRVRAPTTLNVGSMDLLHPELIRSPESERAAGRRLMQAHLELGCEPSFTCAPYQTRYRPRFGEQIAWGESNAIVFANSVIGARTNRYGDFIDLCCAMTGRAPAFGLHLDECRRGEILFRISDLPDSTEATDALYVGIGCLIGARAGNRIAVIEGLPPPKSEDQLKALGAVAASTGATALFHAIGITPEAPTRRDAFAGYAPGAEIVLTRAEIALALAGLSTAREGARLTAVSLGTPHFSLAEFRELAACISGFRPAPGVEFFVNTGRETYEALTQSGERSQFEAAGIAILTDTCTYVTSVLRNLNGVVMTNSGKWAHYAPGNIGVEVAFGSMRECVASAAAGKIVRLAQ